MSIPFVISDCCEIYKVGICIIFRASNVVTHDNACILVCTTRGGEDSSIPLQRAESTWRARELQKR